MTYVLSIIKCGRVSTCLRRFLHVVGCVLSYLQTGGRMGSIWINSEVGL